MLKKKHELCAWNVSTHTYTHTFSSGRISLGKIATEVLCDKNRTEWSVDFDYSSDGHDDFNCDQSYWHDGFLLSIQHDFAP